MHSHDPTTYHKQGIDKGSQYRSVLFYQTEEELKDIKEVLKEIENKQSYLGSPKTILTEICLFTKYYPAETYHQDYYTTNPYDQECTSIIAPKVERMREKFKEYYVVKGGGVDYEF